MLFSNAIKTRNHDVEGKSDWMWTASDDGAWDGPVQDWISHKEKYQKYCKNFRSVFQAGGNHGLYARLFSNLFQNVYTFEPDPLNFHCLVNNCQSPNIFKFNCALGATPKLISLDRPTMQNTGMHQVSAAPGHIPMLTLDTFPVVDLDLIQLDVEGYEYDVLLGGVNTIRFHSPVISVERTNSSIDSLLGNLGYTRGDQSHADTFYWKA